MRLLWRQYYRLCGNASAHLSSAYADARSCRRYDRHHNAGRFLYKLISIVSIAASTPRAGVIVIAVRRDAVMMPFQSTIIFLLMMPASPIVIRRAWLDSMRLDNFRRPIEQIYRRAIVAVATKN